MENWMREIKIADLDEKNREIAELIGVESLLLLLENFGGDRIYFNKIDEVTKSVRDRKIKNEYNRYNLIDLAKKYDLTVESVRRILRDEPPEGQMSIFDQKT